MKFNKYTLALGMMGAALLGGSVSQTVQAYTFDPDVPVTIQNQIKSDLSAMAQIQGQATTPLHQEIFGPVQGSSYIHFFESRVTHVGMNSCGSSKAVACVIPWSNPSKIWFTQNYVNFSHPMIAKLMIVLHEARHTETKKGNWSHATCPTPFLDPKGQEMKSIWTGAPLAGEPACDSTPFGSYGSSTILLKNIAKNCSNCTEKMRMDAGIYSDDQLNRITNPQAKQQMLKDFGGEI